MVVARPALAQNSGGNSGQSGGLKGFISLGAGLIPDYEGSDDYSATPYVEGRANLGNYYVRFEGGALRFNLVDSDRFHAGPRIGFRRGRGDVGNRAVSRLHHIKDSVTAGGFVEYEHVHKDPRAGERVTLTLADDITGNDSGWEVDLRGVIRRPVNFIDRGLIASFEADTTWSSQNYMQSYFGVTPSDSLRSGLPAYGASAGMKSIGAALALDQFLSRKWSVGVRFHYARLMGAAANSPVTAIAGSPNQYFVGLVAGYVL